MRKIQGQVVASTGMDLSGDKLSEEQLRSLFEQMTDPLVCNQAHDMSKPPGAKVYNKRLVRLDSGELAIACDFDLYDESLQIEAGGFSVAYTYRRLTNDPSRDADIQIVFSPRIVESRDVKELLGISDHTVHIEALAIEQKAAEEVAIVIIKFILTTAAAGFFAKAGANVYDRLKTELSKLAQKYTVQSGHDLVYHFTYIHESGGGPVEVLIAIAPDNLFFIQQKGIDLQSVNRFISETVGHSRVMRVVLRLQEEAPYWTIDHIVDKDGLLIEL